jgi:hypothetical protein
MSRKDYIVLARILNEAKYEGRGKLGGQPFVQLVEWIEGEVADYLAQDNPNLDRSRFTEACRGERIPA